MTDDAQRTRERDIIAARDYCSGFEIAAEHRQTFLAGCAHARTELATVAARARAEALREIAKELNDTAAQPNCEPQTSSFLYQIACDIGFRAEAAAPPPAEPAPPVAAPEDGAAVAIGGDRLEGTIADHVRACEVLIADEQSQHNPDNAVIAVLCNSVRLAREHTAMATRGLVAAPEDGTARQLLAELVEACNACDPSRSPELLFLGAGEAFGAELNRRMQRSTSALDAARAYLASAPVAAERAAVPLAGEARTCPACSDALYLHLGAMVCRNKRCGCYVPATARKSHPPCTCPYAYGVMGSPRGCPRHDPDKGTEPVKR